MTFFIQLRTKVRHFISVREVWVFRVLRFAILFATFLILNHSFGYQKILTHWWISLLLSLVGMALPLVGSVFLVIFIALMHLMTLSTDVAVAALVLMLISYAVCAYFRASGSYDVALVPACYYLHIPFLVPMEAALFRSARELVSVLCGGVIAFYLKTVSQNASSFLDPSTEITAADMIQSQMLGNGMFYIFLISLMAMFLVTFYVRTKDVEHAWLLAVLLGVLSSFVVMLTGLLFVGSRNEIVDLVVGEIVTLLVGLLFVFFGRGFDYTRTEHVQFEDDEYYYYVTAVPKMHIPEQEKEIKRITSETATLPINLTENAADEEKE